MASSLRVAVEPLSECVYFRSQMVYRWFMIGAAYSVVRQVHTVNTSWAIISCFFFVILIGVIGCLQATEALKVLGEFGEPLAGRLCTYDSQDGSFYTVRLRPR